MNMETIKQKFIEIMSAEAEDADLTVALDEITFAETLSDLGFDSMNQMNILVELEDAFDVRFPEGEIMAIPLSEFIKVVQNKNRATA